MKNTKRLLAMILVACICAGTVNMPVFAEDAVEEEIEEVVEGETEETEETEASEASEETEEYPEGVTEETIENADGTVTELTATKTTEVDENGNVTVTLTIDKVTEGTNTDGAKVEGESSETEKTVTDGEGNVVEESSASESTTVTTETEVNEDGDTTVTETIVETKDEVNADGSTLDYDQTTVNTKTENADGSSAEQSVVDGTEKKEWSEEDAGEGAQPEVTVDLIPGETTTGTASETVVEGDIPEGEGDTEYDYTEITTTDRTVEAEASDMKVTVNDTNSGLVEDKEIILTGPAPVYDEDDDVVRDAKGEIINAHGKVGMFDNQFNDGLQSQYADPSKWTGENSMPEDADLRFVGTGEHTTYYASVCYVIYEKDDDGNTVYDDDGNPVIKEIWRYKESSKNEQLTINGENATELPEDIVGLPDYDNSKGVGGNRPTLHAMMDKYGNVVYSYCIDNMVDTKNGDWYTMSNLEDANYYATEDAENHVRNIVLNGYWGTTDVQKEDGTYEEGSVESIKAKLKEAIAAGKLDNMVQLPGKEEPVDILEFIDALTPGEAMIATQAAIWSYSNGSYATQNGIDGFLVVDPDQHANHASGSSKPNEDILDDIGGARIDFVYTWLMGLDEEEESTVIINEKNFVEDMSLTVKDKVEEHEDNEDEDTDNDVYNTELNFRLAFVPDPENDDLLVYLIDENGEIIEDKDGNPIIKRLTENGSENDDYEVITPVDGVYTLTGLQLSENEDFNFDLRLEGTQLIERGVYIYESYRGRDVAQNFVGVAEGERNVDVSASMTISFDVDEDNHVVAEREWHYESDPVIVPVTPPETPEEPVTPPVEPVTPPVEPVTPPEEPEIPETPEVPEEPEEPEEPEVPETPEEPEEPVEEEPVVVEEIVEEPVEEIVIEIEDEDIPLTEIPDEPIPTTGDSFFWYICSAIAALGLSVVTFFDKRRKNGENA